MKMRGFTIIELMITIAIVGILATVAIPAYQNYTIRARVAEGLSLVNAAQLAVAESAHSNGGILPTTASAAGYQPPSPTPYVSSIGINNGLITITYTALAGNGTIIFTPTVVANSGEITWACNTGTLIDNYRPPICRLGTGSSTSSSTGSSTTGSSSSSGNTGTSSGNGNTNNSGNSNGNSSSNGNTNNSSNGNAGGNSGNNNSNSTGNSFLDWLLGLLGF